MRKHLSEDALLGAVEDAPDRGALDHLRGCDECAERVSELRSTFDTVATAAVPEPPEVFWEDLRREIRLRVAAETPRSRWRWLWAPGLAVVATGLVTIALLPAPPVRQQPAPTLPAWSAAPEGEDTAMAVLTGLDASPEDLAAAVGDGGLAEDVASLSDEETLVLTEALKAQMKGGAL